MNRLFYILILAIISIIFISNPFMRYPYDMWAHLIAIDNPFDYTTIPEARQLWHSIWREIFNIISIKSSDILLRAKIIHITQTLIAFGAVYLFSIVVVRNIYINSSKLHQQYMAFWSTVIWFTIFATFSMHYHHTWIMWYSISYQITLPLFWYIIALTLILFLEKPTRVTRVFYILQIIAISLFIIQIHSMEYIYYLFYLLALSLIFYRETLSIIKKYFYIILPIFLIILLYAQSYQAEDTRLLDYISRGEFREIYNLIFYEGDIIVSGLNRASSSINELMYVILIFTILTARYMMRSRVYLFLILTSLSILVPLFPFTAGVSALITKINVVHRIYYSSSLYTLLPLSIYYLSIKYNIKKIEPMYIFNISMATIIISTILYSKYLSHSHNYYKNIQSLKQSIEGSKVKFNLSDNNIATIGNELKIYKKSYPEALFYARGDVAVVLKYIYRENVYWRGRRGEPSLTEFYKYCTINKLKECIIFNRVKSLPPYRPYW